MMEHDISITQLITIGPLVRIGPNEVSFYSMEIYDIVFKAGTKFRKDPTVYGEFVQGGHPALFSISYELVKPNFVHWKSLTDTKRSN